MTLSQPQFDALTAYIDAAVNLAASCETCYGGEPRSLAAFAKAKAVAQAALVQPVYRDVPQ